MDGARFTFHSLRHGGATETALAGIPLEIVAKRGRWRVLSSASRYVQMGISLLASIRLGKRAQEAHQLLRMWPFPFAGGRPLIS